MPTPAQLMKTISTATGVPLATVVDMDRRLVAAGYRQVGGRGLNVTPATPMDAARLLTAVLASPRANEAVDAVMRYEDTGVTGKPSRHLPDIETEIDQFPALSSYQSFIQGLKALILTAAGASYKSAGKGRGSPSIEVFAFTRSTYGRIRIRNLVEPDELLVEYMPRDPRQQLANPEVHGDLEQSRRITERTIIAVARLFEEERKNAER